MILHGDCLEVLAGLPENSVDTCITDPPYELGFMGKKWDSSGVAFQLETWQAVFRVLNHNGLTSLANLILLVAIIRETEVRGLIQIFIPPSSQSN